MKKSKIHITPPDGIIVTLPASFYQEHNHELYLKECLKTDKDFVWYRVTNGRLPTQDFLYVYTIINGKIHHRANYVGVEKGRNYRFKRVDGTYRTYINANAILTTGPVVMAPYEIPMKGFQGFRYTKLIF